MFIAAISALATLARGAAVYSADQGQLYPRMDYQVGVNLYADEDCSKNHFIGYRNHDVGSCNAGAPTMDPIKCISVKDDGSARGAGCLTIWETGECTGYHINMRNGGNMVIPVAEAGFGDSSAGFAEREAHCVVVGSNRVFCDTLKWNCDSQAPIFPVSGFDSHNRTSHYQTEDPSPYDSPGK